MYYSAYIYIDIQIDVWTGSDELNNRHINKQNKKSTEINTGHFLNQENEKKREIAPKKL